MQAEMVLGEAEKSSAEALKSSETNLKTTKEHLDVHKAAEKHIKQLICQAPQASCELSLISSQGKTTVARRSREQSKMRKRH